jgi:hypothetical protein
MKLFNISDRKGFLDSWDIQAKDKKEAIHLFCDYYNIKWQLYIDRLVIKLIESDE